LGVAGLAAILMLQNPSVIEMGFKTVKLKEITSLYIISWVWVGLIVWLGFSKPKSVWSASIYPLILAGKIIVTLAIKAQLSIQLIVESFIFSTWFMEVLVITVVLVIISSLAKKTKINTSPGF